MAEEINIDNTAGKEEIYQSLIPQIEALLSGEVNLVANMANVAAALKQAFDFFWVGFYVVDGENMVLGPFQGPIACTRIARDQGVCGKVWADKKLAIVPNVDEFPGHIACNSAAKSEVVVPGFDADGQVLFVLDIDSDQLNDFDEADAQYLSQIANLL